MRQHRTAHHVTDGENVRQIGAIAPVDLDETPLIQFEPHRLRTQIPAVRHATDRNDQLVVIGALGCALVIRVSHRHALGPGLDRRDIHAGIDLQILHTVEYPERFLRHLLVRSRQKRRQRFQNVDVRA